MKILVTGSSGFVGSRLVKELRALSYKVVEFDAALGNDVADAAQCKKAVQGIDAVYHLAAVLDEHSKLLQRVNVQGTQNLLEAAAQAHCKQFIFLSTVGVHAGVKGKVKEGSPVMPRTAYEKSKADAEKAVQEAQEMLPVTVLRAALVFGPNQYWQEIVRLARKGYPIIGGGKQQWQTIFIDDLVDAMLFVLLSNDCMGETFIVAEREQHSLRDLYAEIQRQLGITAKIKTVPVFLARMLVLANRLRGKKSIVTPEHIDRLARERNYDTGKIAALGWKSKTSMREAVR
ncbi:MAG: NAD-dependent epimerase/dehydratase family protein, partial [Candidatus Diapherotrites archaeon]|nr:NAD-dependent epimerase/dehydratase family protein [Candidatus Diapherotrites archaeon]